MRKAERQKASEKERKRGRERERERERERDKEKKNIDRACNRKNLGRKKRIMTHMCKDIVRFIQRKIKI